MAEDKTTAEHAMDREQMNETGYSITNAVNDSSSNDFLAGLEGLPPLTPPGA